MKKLLYLLIGVLFIGVIPVTASAESEVMDVAFNDTVKDIMFEVEWDVEQPDIIFTSPGGTQFDPAKEEDSTLTVYAGDSMYYIINGAEAGQWKATYDKKANTVFTVTMKDYQTKLIIQSFETGVPSGDQLETKFFVKDSRESLYYQYRISAVADKQGLEERVLAEGGAYANQEVIQAVYLNELGSHDGYMLKLYVWYSENGTDIEDYVYSEPFDYTNPSVSQTEQDFTVVIKPEEYTADISWMELPWNAESSLFAMFVNNTAEPVAYDTYGTGQEELNLSYGTEAKELRFEFSYKEYNRYTQPLKKTVDLSNAPVIELTKEEVTNNSSITLNYSGFLRQMGLITVNGVAEEVVLDGAGDLSIQLKDEWNDIIVSYDAGDGITWRWERSIYVDRQAPVLNMLENYTGIHTEEAAITMVGTALDCASVTIGNNEVIPAEDGSFSFNMSLNDGLNTIGVTARDVAGNEAIYTATITKDGPDAVPAFADTSDSENITAPEQGKQILGGFLPLAISGGISVILVLYALIFWRKKKSAAEIHSDITETNVSEEAGSNEKSE